VFVAKVPKSLILFLSFLQDCQLSSIENVQKLNGPLEWADSLATDKRGLVLVTQNEKFELSVWDLSDPENIGHHVQLCGHNQEVLCAKFLWPFLASAGEDKTVRIWKLKFSDKNSDLIVGADCVRILSGHEGLF
jgi:WD40 repeat protein